VLSAAFQQQFMQENHMDFKRDRDRQGRSDLRPRQEVTLAQRLSIVPLPPPKLTTGEWKDVHSKAFARNMDDYECPICCEPFHGEEQVLLSCTHVFHKGRHSLVLVSLHDPFFFPPCIPFSDVFRRHAPLPQCV
jgi:hypothetical protein